MHDDVLPRSIEGFYMRVMARYALDPVQGQRRRISRGQNALRAHVNAKRTCEHHGRPRVEVELRRVLRRTAPWGATRHAGPKERGLGYAGDVRALFKAYDRQQKGRR